MRFIGALPSDRLGPPGAVRYRPPWRKGDRKIQREVRRGLRSCATL
jgi:hypothetical protein